MLIFAASETSYARIHSVDNIPIMTVGSDIAAGATAPFTGATLGFNDKVTNQDACKGATVNLSYLSS